MISESLLTAVDSNGQIHCYMDGSYSLGVISLGPTYSATSLIKDPFEPSLCVYVERVTPQSTSTGNQPDTTISHNFLPLPVSIPLLNHKSARQVATNCSIARHLLWHAIRACQEMQRIWIGDGRGQEGARDVNTHWFKGYMDYLRQYGSSATTAEWRETTALLDVTCLLTNGRESALLGDYLSSSEHTSERVCERSP